MRQTLGTAVFSGMLGVTLFGIFLTPVFFFTIDWLGGDAAVRLAGRCNWSATCLLARRHAAAGSQSVGSLSAGERRDSGDSSVRRGQPGQYPTPAVDTIVIAARRNRDGNAGRTAASTHRQRRTNGAPSRAGSSGSAARRRTVDSRRPAGRRCRTNPSSISEPSTAVFSKFFINRPIFASVLSIVITLAGGISLFTLPIAQYPEITPPTVEVSATYPGANAAGGGRHGGRADRAAGQRRREHALHVVAVHERRHVHLTITFKNGIDLNMAQVLVQNRVSLAEPILPDLVKRRGVTVKKKSPSMLLIVNLFSPDGSRDNLVSEQLRHDPAQGRTVAAAGRGRHHLPRPARLQHAAVARSRRRWPRAISRPATWSRTIEQQNTQVAAGQIGQPPVNNGPGVSVHDQHDGPADRSAAIRRDDHQDRHARAARAAERRGPDRAGRPRLRSDLHARRQAVGGAVDLSAARLQRPGHRPGWCGRRWRS